MENLRKMLMAMAQDIRVILIKICDRLHNMRTMEYQSPAKQREKALETHGDLRPHRPPPGYAADEVGAGGPVPPLSWTPWAIKEIEDELAGQAQRPRGVHGS